MPNIKIGRAQLHENYVDSTRDSLRNLTKKLIFNKACFYLPHASDKIDTHTGQIRDAISFERNITRLSVVKPQVPRLTIHNGPYNYIEGEWYVSFANAHLGGGYLNRGFVQEEILCLEFPEMTMLISSFNWYHTDEEDYMIPMTYKEYAIFTDLYMTVKIKGYGNKGFDEITSKLRSVTSKKVSKETKAEEYDKIINEYVTPVTPIKVNFLAIDATDISDKDLTDYDLEEDFDYIRNKMISAFQGLLDRGVTRIHTGKLGCGAFCHQLKDIARITREAADITGMDIIFYLYDGKGRDIVEEAFK